MRICYIADGVSLHTRRWVNYFAQKGHEVHLISSRFTQGYEGYDERIKTYPLIRLPQIWRVSSYVSGMLWPIQVRSLLARIKPDVLDAHFIIVNGYLAAFSGFHPLILTAWGSDILIAPEQNPIHGFLAKQSLKRADCVICVSSALKGEIVKLGSYPDKVKITPIGVNTEMFSPQKRRAIPGLGIPDSAPVVISMRKLLPLYDVETLVKAIPLVLEEVPETRFIIAGEGGQQGYLERLAASLNVIDNVRFVGQIPHEEIPQYLASANVYVSTSLSDGASISLLEAMSNSLAPVVTDIPANQPWVKDGENGFLFPARDHKMLAARITVLLKDDKAASKFGKISRNIVRERANHEKEMVRVEEIYREVIRTKRVGGSFREGGASAE